MLTAENLAYALNPTVADAGNGMLPRVVPKTGAVLSGRFLPAGTIVASSGMYMARSEELFPDARAFKPERWLDEDHKMSYALDAYLTQFGKGSRQCIGKNLAISEIYMTLAQVFRTCNVQPSVSTPSTELHM